MGGSAMQNKVQLRGDEKLPELAKTLPVKHSIFITAALRGRWGTGVQRA